MFDCWRSVLCKKTGSNIRSSLRRPDEAEKEEGDPQIDVPDVIRLVRDPPEQSHPPAGRGPLQPHLDLEAVAADRIQTSCPSLFQSF
ncbi:Guanine nucleotide exchange factor DBS [Vulpes lagopus]